MSVTSTIVAHQTIAAVRANGECITICLEIGIPTRVQNAEGVEEWACPVSLKPLYSKLHDAHGGSSLQSLCLALSLALDLLDKVREDGGKLFYDDGTELSLETYAFGRVARGSAR